jgi:hypothetical protein
MAGVESNRGLFRCYIRFSLSEEPVHVRLCIASLITLLQQLPWLTLLPFIPLLHLLFP